ncbi:MAG: cupin domain-containing protein [Blastocatellia bacterium]|jgi:quercetin dioxygenase-like cupin family protein
MIHHKVHEVQEERLNELFSRKFFNGEQITLAFINIGKGGVVPTHHHESEQFSYCLTGSIRFNVDGRELVVRAGELLQIPSNVPHSAIAEEDFTGIDVFSPPRRDWIDGTDDYLRR